MEQGLDRSSQQDNSHDPIQDEEKRNRPSNSNYLRLAAFMGKHHSNAIFRRYRHLAAQVLLWKQAELAHLDASMKQMPIPLTTDKNPNWAQNWEVFEKSPEYGLYFKDLTLKLKEFYEFLALYREVDNLPDPTELDIDILRQWLHHPLGGNNFPRACEHLVYDDEAFTSDLLTTCERRHNRDRFSAFISDHATTFLNSTFSGYFNSKHQNEPMDPDDPRLEANFVEWDDRKIRRFTGFIVVLVSYAVPAGALFALYFIPSNEMVARLVAVVGFSAVFSACLKFFTKARPIEIFAAVAAFASVQIVFVSNAGSSTPGSPS